MVERQYRSDIIFCGASSPNGLPARAADRLRGPEPVAGRRHRNWPTRLRSPGMPFGTGADCSAFRASSIDLAGVRRRSSAGTSPQGAAAAWTRMDSSWGTRLSFHTEWCPPAGMRNYLYHYTTTVLPRGASSQLMRLHAGTWRPYSSTGRSTRSNSAAWRMKPRSVGCEPSTVPSPSSPSRLAPSK